jgi:mannose-1-phosphate guanylyltransferase
MAGGIGSRFWPMSRTTFPKQFHDILGIGKSMIRMTYDRFLAFIPQENILIVTHERYRDLVKEQLPEVRDSEILLEPVGRNTAPCIAYAAFKIRQRNPHAGILVAGSDYLILNEENFRHDVELGLDEAAKGNVIMTLGIPPTRPDTGYGYIQYLEPEEGTPEPPFYKVKTFAEKPDLVTARTFLESGDFLWNSGMFIFSVDTILAAFRNYMFDLYDIFEGIHSRLDTDQEATAIGDAYARCRNDSIDKGVMEKAEKDNIYVIPASFDWSDLGTWGSVYEHVDPDDKGNAVQGNVVVYDSSNNLVRLTDSEKLVVLHGVNDFIVVDTGDVLLICKMENEQSIKEVVADMRKQFGEKLV